MGEYCGQCEKLDFRKRRCSKHNKKLSYTKRTGSISFTVFEKCDECKAEPELGLTYWTIDEFWGVLRAFPVTLIEHNPETGCYTGIWHVGGGMVERCEGLAANELFGTMQGACAAIEIERARLVVERNAGRL